MKKNLVFCAGISFALLMNACSNPEIIVEKADQIKATCDPAVLVATAGKVKATFTVTFPEKYFEPSAVLDITPVLKYGGRELLLENARMRLQGEKVKGNDRTIPVTGGSDSREVKFDYSEDMSIATLELRVELILKDKRIPFPKTFKVADGIVANYVLAEAESVPLLLDDSYKQAAEVAKNAEIKFLINKTDVRSSELKNPDIEELRNFLVNNIASAKNARIKKLYISSYASPDGPLQKNEDLSLGRGKSAKASIDDFFKKLKSKTKFKLADSLLNIEHTAEDWDGFQKLMEASSIEDKHLVLRVLSMHSDPEVRETEIKNISKVYKEIAELVLPDLRRSKLSLTAETLDLSDEELKSRIDANLLDELSAEQLLYAARNFYNKDTETQKAIYQFAVQRYNDHRIFNNLGALFLSENNVGMAQQYLQKAQEIAPEDAHVNNNLGYVALKNGDNIAAESSFNASGLDGSKEGLGYLAILKGNYSNAVNYLGDIHSVDAGLAYLLTGRLEKAKEALEGVEKPKAYYILAIVAARENNAAGVTENLNKAAAADASVDWKGKAKKNIEFANFWQQIQ